MKYMSVRVVVILLLIQAWLIGSAGMTVAPAHSVSSQDPSWSDDFQDGNFDDWTTISQPIGVFDVWYPGNFSIINGALTAQYPEWNLALHENMVAYGTWSFDLFAVDAESDEIVVYFIVGEHSVEDYLKDAYGIQLLLGPYKWWTEDGITLLKGIDFPNDLTWLGYKSTGTLDGWQHIDVTRDSTGEFCVYLNGSLCITAVDQQVQSSNLFTFSTFPGRAIDNITVTSETITIDKAPPHWLHSFPENVSLNLNTALRYDLNASDTSGIDSYRLNDTVNFAIDDEGIVTNRTNLDLGQYGLHVWVNDTNGYTLEGSFSIIVTEATSPGFTIPTEVLIVGAVAAVVMIVLVVVIMRSKKN